MEQPPGRVVLLAQCDYLYGIGPLALRVERIDRAHPTRRDGDLWYRVQGVEIGYGGTELGAREVLVRASRLPPSR